jgi:hypothetical protein
LDFALYLLSLHLITFKFPQYTATLSSINSIFVLQNFRRMNSQKSQTEMLNYFNRLSHHKQNLMIDLAKNMIDENSDDNSMLIQENIDELDARWLEFKSGKSMPLNWNSVKKDLIKKIAAK